MDKHILERLRKAGLTGNESRVYFELLKKGQLSANLMAKNIGMDRTLTYTVFNHLIEKGMVSYVIQGNKKLFNASSPENLLNPVKKQEAYIQDLLPDLKSIEQSVGIVQEISVYEGKEGMRTFARLLMKYKSFDSFGATGRAYDLLIEAPRLAKELEKSKSKIRLITHPKYKKHPMKIKNCDIKYLDLKSEATTTIFGDYMAIHIIKEKPSIILIRNKYIAESYKNHFEVLWKVAHK